MMLVIKTKLGLSAIEGIGLFADQFIRKGAVIWVFDPRFDILFNHSDVERMSEIQRDLIIHFSYYSIKSGRYVYSIDNSRFTNHSSNPNVGEEKTGCEGSSEIRTVALRDIQIGEEITEDYREIDLVDRDNSEGYLKG
jgi:SET domain-containing protein